MLGKLIKYEFRATGRIFLSFYVAMLALGGINRLFMEFNLFDDRFALIPGITVFLYVLLICVTFVLTFVVMLQRFYKNLLGDEGYLMFTLPVKPAAHIISKMLVSFAWLMASLVITGASVLILMADVNMGELWGRFFGELGTLFSGGYGQNNLILALELIAGGILSIFSSTLMVYAAIALGHLFHRHRVLASFGAYFVLMVVVQIVSVLVMSMPVFQVITNQLPTAERAMSYMTGVFLPILLVLEVLFGIGCFLITKTIFTKRLNLE